MPAAIARSTFADQVCLFFLSGLLLGSQEATAGGAGDVGSLGVQVLDATVESLLEATVESLIDSGKLLRVSNQVTILMDSAES